MSGRPILRTLAMAACAALLVTALAGPATAGTEKVTICHMPGTPAEGTIEVAAAAVNAHVAHGDVLGGCGGGPTVDACTAINDPAYDEDDYAAATINGVVFQGDERVRWYVLYHSPFAVRIAIGPAEQVFTAWPYLYPGYFEFDYSLPDPNWIGGWRDGPMTVVWESTAGELLDWWVECTHTQ